METARVNQTVSAAESVMTLPLMVPSLYLSVRGENMASGLTQVKGKPCSQGTTL